MQPISFTAETAEEAVAQIRARLGPEAVVLNVRRLPANGLARLWQKPLIEVLAHKPEPVAAEVSPITATLDEFRQQLLELQQQVGTRPASAVTAQPCAHQYSESENVSQQVAAQEISDSSSDNESPELFTGKWRVGEVLRKSGLLPLPAQQVLDRLHVQFGEQPPATLGEEIQLAQAVLASAWRKPAHIPAKSRHVLIGPAGSGKTTFLCKWLTQEVLMDGRSARIWRLDGATANTAESLSVYCEILNAPCERAWLDGSAAAAEDICFIDLPGVDWRKPLAVKELGAQLKQLGSPRVHLVLNAAYEVSVLMQQARAFGALPVEDIILTHLDEQPRWGRIWNLVLGTNYSVRYFSTGQNIPGDYCAATPEMIIARQFPHK